MPHKIDRASVLGKTPPLILMVFAVLAVVNFIYAFKAGYPLRYHDERQYLEIAQSLAQGDGFLLNGKPTAYRPPVWPLLLAALLVVGVGVPFLPLLSAALMVVAAALAGLVGVRVTRNRWGALAGPAVLAYPLNLYGAGTLYPQALATALLLGLWLVAAAYVDEGRTMPAWVCALVGLMVAALALSVPTLLFAGGMALVWLWWRQEGTRVRFATVALAFLLLPIAAWTARNVMALDSPVTFSTSSGRNLWLGNNAQATAASGVGIDDEAVVAEIAGLTEVEKDAYYRGEAVAWVTGNPGEAARLYVAKVANYFVPYNEPVTRSQGSGAEKLVAYAAFGALVLGTVARLLLRRRVPLRPSEVFMLVVFLANALFMAVFFTRVRFRLPLDSVLVVESAVAVVGLLAVVAATKAARPGIRRPARTGAQ